MVGVLLERLEPEVVASALVVGSPEAEELQGDQAIKPPVAAKAATAATHFPEPPIADGAACAPRCRAISTPTSLLAVCPEKHGGRRHGNE